jgi:hypothetical protein
MKLILKLKGKDASGRSVEHLTTTENVSAGGFRCPLSLDLPSDLTFQVFLSGASLERYIGSVLPIRREAAYTRWQEYAF